MSILKCRSIKPGHKGDYQHGKTFRQVAVITGCSVGLGKQIALRFAAEGANLAICARSADKLAATAKLCEEKGAEVLAVPTDLTDVGQLTAFVEAAAAKFGTIDVLVNNAVSIAPPHPFLEHSIEQLNLTMTSGFYATWHMMKLCFPYMKNKKDASIINFGSSGGDLGMDGFAAYAATKEAIRGVSRVVAREWGKHNIRVNVVSPVALTEHTAEEIENLPEEQKAYIMGGMAGNPMGRVGDPYEDVAPVVVFLASEESRWITGQNINAEGGGTIHA